MLLSAQPGQVSYMRSVRPSVRTDLGRWSVTLRTSRPGWRFGMRRQGQSIGALGLGTVIVYWLRRPPGSRSWGLHPERLFR